MAPTLKLKKEKTALKRRKEVKDAVLDNVMDLESENDTGNTNVMPMSV